MSGAGTTFARHLRKQVPIVAVKVTLQDVTTIYNRIGTIIADQCEHELANATKLANQSDEDFAAFKDRAREQAFKVTTTITGANGAMLLGDTAAVFSSANVPDRISSIYLTNVTAYQNFAKVRPLNAFELNLDFSKPPLFDAQNPVSAATKNNSNLMVEGNREAWVASINDAAFDVLNERRTRRAWLHRGFVYDLGVLIFGVPFAFYASFRVHGWIDRTFQNVNQFVLAAAYVYIFLLVLNIYRGLFGYTKWAFPAVELISERDTASRHRAVWAAIILSLIGDTIHWLWGQLF